MLLLLLLFVVLVAELEDSLPHCRHCSPIEQHPGVPPVGQTQREEWGTNLHMLVGIGKERPTCREEEPD